MTTADSPKNVTKKRHDFTKPEREYVKGIVHNLSLQRLTDQEIVQWLHDEKQIDLDRSTVSKMSNQIDKQAERWYIDLRNSAYRYLAQYKQRIDSLLSYQRTLHEIISNTNKDEVKIRAISELHSIEMDILSLWKQLPASNIVNTVDNTENEKKVPWAVQIGGTEAEGENKIPEAIAHDIPGIDEQPVFGFDSEPWTVDNNKDKDKEIESKPEPKAEISSQLTSTIETETEEVTDEPAAEIIPIPEIQEQGPDIVDIDILGRWPKPFDVEPWIQCKFNNSDCNKWFKTKEIRSKHITKYHT